ncbi:MAG TPA: MoxR family ATPase [Gemmataceae bacterium]|nr:MoxR family ATPase [Gemmataceae bacterium]
MQQSPSASVNHAPTASDGVHLRELAQQIQVLRDRVLAEVAQVVVGMEDVTLQFLIALFAGGHVLLEGVPGVAKTTLSKVFARVLGIQYQRLQFTPDLLPSDVTGTYIFDRKQNEFSLRRGPIFCQVLLADEVNRAPAKTQSALLEAMQENQVTIEGTTLLLPRPFMVLATQNPVEQEGVYRLPEAQLDRFLLRVEMGYPGRQGEVAMLHLHSHPTREVRPLFSADQILELQDRVNQIYGEEGLMEYIVELAEASRTHSDVMLGASPRASLCLLKCARARALLDGRHYFTHEDVQAVAVGVLGHRLIIRPEAEVEGKRAADVVRDLIASAPVLTSR